MTTEITCYNCRFFSPGENGCPSYLHNEEIGEFDEAKEGLCRRKTPRHGKTLRRPNGDEFVCFAEWPKVMHCDWCGKFKPRQQRHSDVDGAWQDLPNRTASDAKTPSAHRGS